MTGVSPGLASCRSRSRFRKGTSNPVDAHPNRAFNILATKFFELRLNVVSFLSLEDVHEIGNA